MKKIILIIIGLFLLSDYAMSNPDRKIILSIGEIARFRFGQHGIYKDKKYNLQLNPETSLELSGTLYEGLTLGGAGILIFDQTHNLSGDKIQLGWGVGPIISYYFWVHDIVVPYLSMSYTYRQNEVKDEDLVNDITVVKVERFHLYTNTGGLSFMINNYFSIYLSYSFHYESYESRIHTKVEKDGSYHTFGVGCKVFFDI